MLFLEMHIFNVKLVGLYFCRKCFFSFFCSNTKYMCNKKEVKMNQTVRGAKSQFSFFALSLVLLVK